MNCELKNIKTITVPAFIYKRTNEHEEDISLDNGWLLLVASYINGNDQCLVLSYEDSLQGILMLDSQADKLTYNTKFLQENLHNFPSFINNIKDAKIFSNCNNNHQLIFVRTNYVS